MALTKYFVCICHLFHRSTCVEWIIQSCLLEHDSFNLLHEIFLHVQDVYLGIQFFGIEVNGK
jgi:hypothetical protein